MKPISKLTKGSGGQAMNFTDPDHPLFKQPLVQKFLRKYRIDPARVLDEQNLFYTWIAQKEKCAQCAGLEFCRLKPKGAIKIPFVDEYGEISARYTGCSFALKREEELKLKKHYLHSHMTDADYLLSTKDLCLNEQSNEYLAAFMALTQGHGKPGSRGKYLFGAAGSGKTTMLKVVANKLAEKELSLCFVYTPVLIQELRERIDEKREMAKIIERLKECDVLFLDDLGSEHVTSWSRDEILLPILDYRYNNHKTTHFSSNYDFDELIARYTTDRWNADEIASKRFLDRVFALGERTSLPGLSKRHNINPDQLPPVGKGPF